MGKVELPDEELFKYSFYRAGTKIFKQGDKGTDIYILKRGAVTVTVDGQLVGLINTPDTIIGEMAYFLKLERTATIEAIEDSEFIVIPGEYLHDTIIKKPEIGIELLTILSTRLANTTKYASRLEREVDELRDELRKFKGIKKEEAPRLEHELVALGFIKEEQLEECLKEYEIRKKKKEESTLPRILIEKGYLTTEQIVQYLEQKQVKFSD